MTDATTIPLPEPWDYCYEWDGPFGTRKFSTASYNGNRPDRSVLIYTADQMRAHAAAVSAADNAALREHLGNLLAVLHGDGGHYEAEHGTDKAVADALTRFYSNIMAADSKITAKDARIKVLEDALRHVNKCLSINDYGDYVLLSLFDAEIVRTALGDKP